MVKIRELLKGCEVGRLQQVGWMSVIPLTSDMQDDRFVAPNAASISTKGYGTIAFRNVEPKPLLVPAGVTYLVDQKAQNHALPHAALVKAKASQEFNTAMCVQQTQGGYIAEGKHEMMLLPFQLREQAHKVRNTVDFRRLWPEIAEFNASAGVTGSGGIGGGHLEYFFDHFRNQLDTFVAQFEPVKNQVGAIILVGGKVVGVERTPSVDYFAAVWKALIRECYGSLALTEANRVSAEARKKGIQEPVPPLPKTRVPMRKAQSLPDLKAALADVEREEYSQVKNLVKNILDIELSEKVEGKPLEDLSIVSLGENPFVGQLVRDSEKIVYASLVATEHWRKNEDWLTAKPFKM